MGHTTHKWNERLVFFVGAAAFVFFHFGYTVSPLFLRHEPIELDDAYTYAWKAVNFEHCFFSDCVAQNDLWPQYFAPAENEQIAQARRRGATFTFHRYTFLHEWILSIIRKLGFDWATILNVVAVVGMAGICAALIYFLYVVWGPLCAGIALLAVSSQMQWQDLQLVVPYSLLLVIAPVLWGYLFRPRPYSGAVLPIGILLLLLMHPIGRVYSVIALGIFTFAHSERLTFGRFVSISLSCIFLLAAFLVPMFIHRPLINMWDLPSVSSYNWWPHFVATLYAVFGRPWTSTLLLSIAQWIVLGVSFFLSLLLAHREERRRLFITGALLGGALISSLFFVWPGYPADLFRRIWTPIALFFFAAGARVCVAAVSNETTPLPKTMLRGCAIVFAGIAGFTFLSEIPQWHASLSSRRTKHPFVLDVNQTEILQSHAQPNSRVLYLDEVPMLFQLDYGAYRFGATYFPVVQQSNIEARWIRDIQFIVGFNLPFQALTTGTHYPEGIYLDDAQSISLESKKPFPYVELRFAGLDTSSCEIAVERHGETVRHTITAGSPTISETFDTSKPESSFVFRADTHCPGARLAGIRLSPDQDTVWPWENYASIRVIDQAGNSHSAVFDTSAMLRDLKLGAYLGNTLQPSKVFADTGSLLLIENSSPAN